MLNLKLEVEYYLQLEDVKRYYFVHDGTKQVGNGTGITDRSEKTIRSVKAGRFCSWRSEISGHFLHFTSTWPQMSFSC